MNVVREPHGHRGEQLISIVGERASLSFEKLLAIESGKATLTEAEMNKLRVVNRVSDFDGNTAVPLPEQKQSVLVEMFTALLEEGPFTPHEVKNGQKSEEKRIRSPLVLKYPDDLPDVKSGIVVLTALRSAMDRVSPNLREMVNFSFSKDLDRRKCTSHAGKTIWGESAFIHEMRHAHKFTSITSLASYIYMDFRYFVKDGTLRPKLITTMYPVGKKSVRTALAPFYPSSGDISMLLTASEEVKRGIIAVLSKKAIWDVLKEPIKATLIQRPNSMIKLDHPLPDHREEIHALEIFQAAQLELFSRAAEHHSLIDVDKVVF